MGSYSFTSNPVEEVIAVNPKACLSSVVATRSQSVLNGCVRQAWSALSSPSTGTFSHGRYWGGPKISTEHMNLRTIGTLSPEAIVGSRWLWRFGKTLRSPDLRVPN